MSEKLSQSFFQWYPFCWVEVVEKFLDICVIRNFKAYFRPIGGEFEGNETILWIMAKNPSIWYILIYFVKFWKRTLRDPNWYFDCCLDLHAGLTEARNQKVNISIDSFRSHKSRGDLKILKRASVEKLIFRRKQSCIILRENLVYSLSGLRFEKRRYPWTRLDE